MSKTFDKEGFKERVKENVKTLYRKTIDEATQQQLFQAVSYAVKDRIIDNWLATQKQYEMDDPKTVYYMSMEFLMGRALGNNLINLCAYKEVKEALDEMGFDLNVIEDQEPDAALGNGGLGRLAACFLDSLATLGYSAYGCGIRYRYGMFKQKIENGYQVEVPDNWLKDGNPFELRRPEYAKIVKFGGYVRVEYDEEKKKNNFIQEGYQSVRAVPFDLPILGYNNNVVNTLRVWDAEAINDFHLDSFDKGDYQKAVEQENLAKNIVDVLYPNDNHYAGKELRLKQQYFFISASLQALIAKYKKKHGDIRKLYEKVVIQMNDTHPTVAVPELMRLLIDAEGLSWDEAWEVTSKTCAYTNHTIMAEALEKWPIDLFSKLLPRIYQIVQEIDRRFVIQVREMYPGNEEKVRKMAILMDGQVRMANMAIIAGFSVNGVAKLHTEILVENIVGVKEASGNISNVAQIMHLCDGKIDLYSGNDDQVVPLLSLGGLGVISVLSNVAPTYVHEMCYKFFSGDIAGSCKMQLDALPLIDALFCEVNPIPVKAALNMMGKEVGTLRAPLTEMEDAHKEVLRKAMADLGLIQ